MSDRDIKNRLDEVIEADIDEIESLPHGEERTAAIKNLAMLHKLRMDEIRTEAEVNEKLERIAMEKEKSKNEKLSSQMEASVDKIEKITKFGVAVGEIVLPLVFYGVWMKQGFKFEESGVFTSTTFRNLLNRFKPTMR